MIRTQLAWESLRRLGVGVSARVVTSLGDQAGHWIVPWYLSGGRQVSYDTAGAQYLRLDEVPDTLSLLEPERRGFIEDLTRRLAKNSPVQFLMATYRVRDTEIILDGNHRAVAALLSGAECRILVLSIDGPIDPRYLPDLVHWATP